MSIYLACLSKMFNFLQTSKMTPLPLLDALVKAYDLSVGYYVGLAILEAQGQGYKPLVPP
jgi:hypothetical protein